MEQLNLKIGESKRFHDMDVPTADGQNMNIHVGTRFVEVLGNFYSGVLVFLEVIDAPMVTRRNEEEFFVAWKAKDRATGEMISYGVNVALPHYAPCIYAMTSERVRNYLERTREQRKKASKIRKQKGYDRTWTVLKLERRWKNDTKVLVNVKTGKQRVLVRKGNLLIEDKDIDFADIFRGELFGREKEQKKALEEKKEVSSGIELVEHDPDGYGMLMWTYHKERDYFDSDDLEGTDFYLKVYCLVNSDLEIVVPFRKHSDFEYMKKLVKH